MLKRRRQGARFVALVALCSGFACSSVVAQTAQFESWISSGLNSPIGLTHAGDGSGRQFIIQQGGAVRVVRNDTLQTTPLLTVGTGFSCTYPGDASASTVGFTSGGERGVLGLAFHPQFSSNGRVFLSITDVNGDSMVVHFVMSDPSADVMSAGDLASCRVLLRVDQNSSNHNGGNVVFGPDGYLYFGLGDGGSQGDPCSHGQTLDPVTLVEGSGCSAAASFTGNGGDPRSRALLSKMMRIDVDQTTPSGTGLLCGRPRTNFAADYAIPPGQPSVSGNIPEACDEVWSYGFRNPWRFSFDTTGGLFIADVGQNLIEEINYEQVGAGGGNYGWRCREGAQTYNTSAPYCDDQAVIATFVNPILSYTHSSSRCSITGGFRYRGGVLVAQGRYFYGDYCTGEVWAAQAGQTWTSTAFGTPFGFGLTSFGEDETGELYVMINSTVYRLNGDRGLFYDGFE